MSWFDDPVQVRLPHCGLCGKAITDRDSYHDSYLGINHMVCEADQWRKRAGWPPFPRPGLAKKRDASAELPKDKWRDVEI